MPSMRPWRFKQIFLLAALLLGPGLSFIFAGEDTAAIPRFTEIAPGGYRGGQPTEQGLQELKAKGIRTIINFRYEPTLIEKEKVWAAANGIDYVSIPWSITAAPNPKVLDQFLEAVRKPGAKPVLIHCKRGVERTGVMTAVYGMAEQGLDPETAYHKAVDGYPVRWYWRKFVESKWAFYKEILARKEKTALASEPDSSKPA